MLFTGTSTLDVNAAPVSVPASSMTKAPPTSDWHKTGKSGFLGCILEPLFMS